MNNTIESAKQQLLQQLNLLQASALLVGLFYVSGYYINSMFLINYGIPEIVKFRLEYIKIGFVFWLIICAIVFLPFGAFYLTHKIRSVSNLPHPKIGLIGNSLNIIIMLGVPVGLSFFATNFEWNYLFRSPILGFNSFNQSISFSLGISTFAVIILPAIERIFTKVLNPRKLHLGYRLVVEPLRFGSLFLSIYLIYMSLSEIPWISKIFAKSIPFIAVVMILGSGLLAAYYWIKKIRTIDGSLMVIPLITLGIAFFYYLAMASYVYGVYPAIPSNRGGKLPLTEVYVQIDGYDSLFDSAKQEGDLILRGPIYIVEETENSIYFVSKDMDKWFEKFVTINVIKIEDIKYIRSERINNGFPKIKII